jgi:hypothetical protein
MKKNISFSGHDKFDCKIDWLTKGLMAFKTDKQLFNQNDLEKSIEILGLGANMVKSLNHWMHVLGLIENNTLTNISKTILEKDPYIENIDTLWLLHWNIVKNKNKATLYNLFFNTIYPDKFTKEEILQYITHWLDDNKINLSTTTLKSDIDVFIRMYQASNNKTVNLSLFSELNLISEQSNSVYVLNVNNKNISDQVFLYIFTDYISKLNSESISVDDLQRGRFSIQKSLCISESYLYSKIYRLEKLTDGKFIYSEASGIKQIYIHSLPDKNKILNTIYS